METWEMPTSNPLISIVTPTYKRPELLKRAACSVMAQDYENWEWIISDDEYPPGEEWHYASKLSKLDHRIKLIANSGKHGQVGNTNNAMKAAKGDWIKPLHDDDSLRHLCLDVLVRVVYDRPSIAMVT